MKLQHFDGWWRSIDPRPAIVEEQIGSVWSCLLCSGPLRPCTISMRLAATAPWCCLGPVSGFCNVVRALTQFYNQNVSQTSGWRSWKYDFLVPLAIQILKTFRNHTRSSRASDIQFRSRSFYGGFSFNQTWTDKGVHPVTAARHAKTACNFQHLRQVEQAESGEKM